MVQINQLSTQIIQFGCFVSNKTNGCYHAKNVTDDRNSFKWFLSEVTSVCTEQWWKVGWAGWVELFWAFFEIRVILSMMMIAFVGEWATFMVEYLTVWTLFEVFLVLSPIQKYM